MMWNDSIVSSFFKISGEGFYGKYNSESLIVKISVVPTLNFVVKNNILEETVSEITIL